MKESHSIFKFYASGRRHCQSMLATMDLRKRQDLLTMAYYLFSPREDVLDIEVGTGQTDAGTDERIDGQTDRQTAG
jgi:Protein of unknown function (DUF1682)